MKRSLDKFRKQQDWFEIIVTSQDLEATSTVSADGFSMSFA